MTLNFSFLPCLRSGQGEGMECPHGLVCLFPSSPSPTSAPSSAREPLLIKTACPVGQEVGEGRRKEGEEAIPRRSGACL